MTTIASFASLATPPKKTELIPTSITVLSDSQWSWDVNGKVSLKQQNAQKVFICKEVPSIFTYFGDAKTGATILQTCVQSLSANAAARNAKDIAHLESIIKNCFDGYLSNVPIGTLVDSVNIYCVFVFQGVFHHFLMVAQKTDRQFTISVLPIITNKTEVYYNGSGKDNFHEILLKEQFIYKHVNSSAIFFHSFINFLKGKKDPLSSLPCQGAVITIEGVVKPISIKHEDTFYLFGNPHDERANYKFEFDYRDEEFEFLHSDGKIKGRDRKKYNFKDPTKKNIIQITLENLHRSRRKNRNSH